MPVVVPNIMRLYLPVIVNGFLLDAQQHAAMNMRLAAPAAPSTKGKTRFAPVSPFFVASTSKHRRRTGEHLQPDSRIAHLLSRLGAT